MKPTWSIVLNEWLAEEGWSVAELARRADISRDSAYDYVAGEIDNPRGKTLEKIAAAFGRTEIQLRTGVIETAPTRNIPLLSTRDAMNMDPRSNVNSVWGGLTVPAPQDAGERAFLILVDDDACSPTFIKGDNALCDPDAAREPGKFVLAKVSGIDRAVLRKYKPLDAFDDTKFSLLSSSDDYPPINIIGDREAEILGVAIKVIRDV